PTLNTSPPSRLFLSSLSRSSFSVQTEFGDSQSRSPLMPHTLSFPFLVMTMAKEEEGKLRRRRETAAATRNRGDCRDGEVLESVGGK
ncbi:unnamed protein product, partial [Linum tenue]